MNELPSTRRASKRIFIASSQEARGIAKRLLTRLEGIKSDESLLPIPWWEAFGLGQYTFEDLSRQTKMVDGAVIIAAKDDKVWYRGKAANRPRDNVIFEFGLFASKLGLNRTIILKEEGVELPSDIQGVTYLGFKEKDLERAAQKLLEHFSEQFEADLSGGDAPLRVICNPQLAALQISQTLPTNWFMRAMYLGTEGARAWLATTSDPNYETDAERAYFSDLVVAMLNTSGAAFRTYVSLGPGNADVDSAVSLAILEKDPSAQCIPVDLSDGLLWRAIQVLSPHIRVPVGLLADFEEHLKFISRHVREYGKGPYFYGLFGGTFGSLDRPEQSFMRQIKADMDEDDQLMLDVSVLKNDEDMDSTRWGDPTKKFFAYGAARHLALSPEEVFRNFDELITVKGTKIKVPIDGTQLMTVYAKGRAFARARRYNFDGLRNFFDRMGFHVESKLDDREGPYNIGLFSLRKKL